jgi:flagellar basal-body rod protein FlgB
MAIGDLPLVSMLKTRMQWHQARQKVLAENVSNADTPRFKPSDLKAPSYGPGGRPVAGGIAVERTNDAHIALASSKPGVDSAAARRFETTPSGNGVNLEEEMLKVAQNQSDYALVAGLYQKSLSMLRVAVGRRA